MRLKNVESGHNPRYKAMLEEMKAQRGGRVPDILRTILYRPELFGYPFSAGIEEVLRGPSEWGVGERELFAAFVSRQNQCPY
jgi:hypothetical protein